MVIFTVLGTGLLVGQMLVRWRFPLPVVTLVAILLGFLAVFAGGIPWTQAVVRSINNLGGGVLNEPWGNGDLTGVNIQWGCVLLGISWGHQTIILTPELPTTNSQLPTPNHQLPTTN